MWPGVVRRIRVNGESFAYPSLCLVRYTERYRGCEKPVFVTGRSGQGRGARRENLPELHALQA